MIASSVLSVSNGLASLYITDFVVTIDYLDAFLTKMRLSLAEDIDIIL